MRTRIATGSGQGSVCIACWSSPAAAAASVTRRNTDRVESPSPFDLITKP